ncbi:uncharacterized protein si:ch211-248a14.8 [Osmerus mordax]|uniref:uncharacterized protein si:ch211-248a14.8 n=1 Tax=Osmerus mordax TaxID=8014 RepID=UPI00350EFE80
MSPGPPLEGVMIQLKPLLSPPPGSWTGAPDPWDTVKTTLVSERPRWRRCVAALRRFSSSPVWKPLLPALGIIAILGVTVLYILADKLRCFVANIFVPQYHYPYAVPLCFAQVLVTLLALQLLHALGLVPLKPYSLSLGERLLVPSICDSVQAVLGMWAESSHSGLYPLTMRLLPLLSVGWCHGLGLARSPLLHVTVVTVVTVTSVAITASLGLSRVEPLECVYAPLALLLHSLALAWMAKAAEVEFRRPGSHVSTFDLYFTLLVNQSLILGFLCLLHPKGPQALGGASWYNLLFIGYLLAILLLGMVQHFLVDVTALRLSPLVAALIHTARTLVQPFYRF